MAERRKGKQLNFRLSGSLAERFEEYCKARGITMTQFLENSIKQALGEPLTIPQDALGISQNIAKVKPNNHRVTASNVQGLEALVRDIVRGELAVSMGE